MSWSELYGFLHIPFHFLIPLLIYLAVRDRRQLLWLELANLIDLDHLLADPVFAPERCSLTTHPLHGAAAAAIYTALLLIPGRGRIFGAGALLHLLLDSPSCL